MSAPPTGTAERERRLQWPALWRLLVGTLILGISLWLHLDAGVRLGLLEAGLGAHLPARVDALAAIQVQPDLEATLVEVTAALDRGGARVVVRQQDRQGGGGEPCGHHSVVDI